MHMYCGKLDCKPVIRIGRQAFRRRGNKGDFAASKRQGYGCKLLFCMLNINSHNRFVNLLLGLQITRTTHEHMEHPKEALVEIRWLWRKGSGLDSEDIIRVRGKRGRPVPILIPHDIQHLLELFTDAHVHAQVGVLASLYIFANFSKWGFLIQQQHYMSYLKHTF